MARISTHVLDIARGRPAEGLAIDLYSLADGVRTLLRRGVTDADGRVNEPLFAADSIPRGVYELDFHAGDYLRSQALVVDEPPFLDVVTIRFGVSDEHGNYHVPLLLAPHGYSTYRGS